MYTSIDVESLYLEWLQGSSLRELARKVGKSYTTIQTWFRQRYGKDATNLQATSLARTLIADYGAGAMETAQKLIGTSETTKHRSVHSLQQLSNYQCLHDADFLDHQIAIAVGSDLDPVPEALRLPMFLLLVDTTELILKHYHFHDLAQTWSEVTRLT
jgi:hypothetical protein